MPFIDNISTSTNWTYFIRDHIFYPLRECLVLYINIIKQLSKNNPKWDELSEIERDNFIADAIQHRYQWHKGCESEKASIEYLRKWSLLFLEEILDERNFHCFAVRFFCRELLTNNILYPIINLVDGYNVNYAIVSAFIYLETINNDIAKEDIDGDIDNDNDDDMDYIQQQEKEEKKEEKEEDEEKEINDDSNNMISMQEIQQISTPKSINLNDDNDDENDKESETPQIIQKQMSDSGINRTEISMQTIKGNEDLLYKKKKQIAIRKRKRRASLDMDILDHYYKSFKISHFFIEINGDQSELLQLIPMVIRKGYTISCKYEIESQYKFTIRFVSTQCINLCARWVTLIGDSQILGDLSSLKHLKRIEYQQNNGKLRYIYIWNDDDKEDDDDDDDEEEDDDDEEEDDDIKDIEETKTGIFKVHKQCAIKINNKWLDHHKAIKSIKTTKTKEGNKRMALTFDIKKGKKATLILPNDENNICLTKSYEREYIKSKLNAHSMPYIELNKNNIYHAIASAMGLAAKRKDNDMIKHYKKTALEYIANHRHLFRRQIMELYDGKLSITKYLQEKRKNEGTADGVIFNALCFEFNINAKIYKLNYYDDEMIQNESMGVNGGKRVNFVQLKSGYFIPFFSKKKKRKRNKKRQRGINNNDDDDNMNDKKSIKRRKRRKRNGTTTNLDDAVAAPMNGAVININFATIKIMNNTLSDNHGNNTFSM